MKINNIKNCIKENKKSIMCYMLTFVVGALVGAGIVGLGLHHIMEEKGFKMGEMKRGGEMMGEMKRGHGMMRDRYDRRDVNMPNMQDNINTSNQMTGTGVMEATGTENIR